MPKNFLIHTLLLAASVAGVYSWLSSPLLTSYTLQLVALLVLIFAGTHWGRSKYKAVPRSRRTVPLDLSLLTMAILLLVTDTGGLSSPFNFFLFFLLFAVAMLYEIEATLVLTASLLTFFLLLPSTDLTLATHLGALTAIVMVTPLAIFTAHTYEVMVMTKRKEQVLVKALGQTETDTLFFLSTNLKATLESTLDRLTQVIPALSSRHQQKLGELYQDLKSLHRSADELERAIDKRSEF